MANLFVDTSGWGNIIDKTQPTHNLAADIYRTARQANHKIITTNYIITELAALLASPLRIPRVKAIAFIQSLKTSPYVLILHISKDLDRKAWELFSSREDKAWSLVDCSTFVVMQQNNMIQALTTDHHFEQAGFMRLLK